MKVTPETILGTWQSDLEKTLAEIKRHLRPDHPKLHEFTLPERLIPLTVCYTPDSVLYNLPGRTGARPLSDSGL